MTQRVFNRNLILILLLFAAVRAVFLSQLLGSPFLRFLTLDSEYYHFWATELAAGHGNPAGPFWLSPGYPLALSLLFRAAGSNAAALIVITQFLLSAGTLLLLAFSVRRLFGPTVALIAAGLGCIYSPWLYYDGVVLSASVTLLLNSLLLFVLVTYTDIGGNKDIVPIPQRSDRWLWAAAGIITGLSALMRPSILIFAVFLIVWLFLRADARRFSRAVVFAAAILLTFLPVLIRNWSVSGSPVLTTSSGGVNFFIGNRDGASGIYDELDFVGGFDPQREAEGYRAEASRRTGRPLTLTQASRYWAGEALKDIAYAPAAWVKLLLKKLWLTVQKEEIANNLSFRGMAGFVPLVGGLPLRWGLLLPFALGGGILMRVRRAPGRLLWLYALSFVCVNLLFFSSSEYRFPMVLALLPAAGFFFAEIGRMLEKQEWRLLAGVCLSYLVFLIVVNFPTQEVRRMTRPCSDYSNMGTAAAEHGMPDQALIYFTRALAVNPDFRDARLGLAETLWSMGNYDDARREFEIAGASAPDTLSGAPLQNFLERIATLRADHQDQQALDLLDDKFPPQDPAPREVWMVRSQLLEVLGYADLAYDAMLAVHERDPRSPEWLFRAGQLAAKLRQTAVSDSLFLLTLLIDPSYVPSRIELAASALARADTAAAVAQLRVLQKISLPGPTAQQRVDSLSRLAGIRTSP